MEELGSERLVKRVYEAVMEGRRGQIPGGNWNDNFKQ